jgi:hypothetical protein
MSKTYTEVLKDYHNLEAKIHERFWEIVNIVDSAEQESEDNDLLLTEGLPSNWYHDWNLTLRLYDNGVWFKTHRQEAYEDWDEEESGNIPVEVFNEEDPKKVVEYFYKVALERNHQHLIDEERELVRRVNRLGYKLVKQEEN